MSPMFSGTPLEMRLYVLSLLLVNTVSFYLCLMDDRRSAASYDNNKNTNIFSLSNSFSDFTALKCSIGKGVILLAYYE